LGLRLGLLPWAETAKAHKGKQVRRSCRSLRGLGGRQEAAGVQVRAIEGHTGVNANADTDTKRSAPLLKKIGLFIVVVAS